MADPRYVVEDANPDDAITDDELGIVTPDVPTPADGTFEGEPGDDDPDSDDGTVIHTEGEA